MRRHPRKRISSPPVRRVDAVIGGRLGNGNLAVKFSDLEGMRVVDFIVDGIEPERVPIALRSEGTKVWFLFNKREEFLGIERRLGSTYSEVDQ